MTTNTKIEWADHTFNPWEGCQHAGPGCDFCYAEAHNARFNSGTAINWGPGAPRRRTSPANWRKPFAWQRAAPAFEAAHGRRQRVFCASLADVFDNAVPDEWRADLAALILKTPDLLWLLLTKRIGNAGKMLDAMFPLAVPSNVRLGITVVNQTEADRDIPRAIVTKNERGMQGFFLSIEPQLGRIVLTPEWLRNIAEVIAGGESGKHARAPDPDWFRSLRDQCAAFRTPFFFKQWGEHAPISISGDQSPGAWRYPLDDDRRGERMERVGKLAAGRLLDGVEHNGLRP